MSRRPDIEPLQSTFIRVSPRPVVTTAFVVIVGLALAHAAHTVLVHHAGVEKGRHFLSLFDGDAEQSFTNWVSTMLLAVLGVCLLWVSSIASDLKKSWQVLGILVLAISCDEVAGVHERTGILYRTLKSMGLPVNDMFYFGWTLPVLVALPPVAVLFLRFVSALPVRHRRRMSLSAIVYLTGAVGMELWESRVLTAANADTALFHWITLVEEFLEMFGVVLGIRAVLLFLEEQNAQAIVRIASEIPQAAGKISAASVAPKARAATASGH